ncbi:cell wall-binding repeat-containing protein [Clostridium cochlearium]|uniref:cell wall-binding repeat-containing protein n=1 Tax=Clostridium cochlearium TaxID=1494 RepID=UPI0017F16C30|nr:cell wall-binding repeat-containing protein [Clostridium cochlearium]NMA58209.1 cell wall-binding repeat-containing protein [Clostridium cochlearium]
MKYNKDKINIFKLVVFLFIISAISIFHGNNVEAAETTTKRFNGQNRYETAAKVCEEGWSEESDWAIVVNGDNFVDALSVAPLAKKQNAPILLTNSKVLNVYTSMQLNRLKVKNVYVIGGKGVISQNVEDGIKAKGIKVTRLGGKDRYDTALQIAKKLGRPKQIAVINSTSFYDGVSIAPIAALKEMAIIPVGKNDMPNSIEKFLRSNRRAEQIYVIGGQDQISNKVFNKIPNAIRVGSGDVYKRNIDIINAFQNELDFGNVYVASSRDFADALSASALACKSASPIVLAGSNLSNTTKNFMRSKIINNVSILGGNASVSYNTEQILKYLPLKVADTENIRKEIWQNESFTPPPTIVVTASNGNMEEVSVTWNLIRVDTTKPGIYTFTGKVNGYNRDVDLILVVKPLPVKVEDINENARSRERFVLPEKVTAEMSDGSTSELPVIWDYGTKQSNKSGVYVFYGTVEKYDKKVKLTLTVTEHNTTP